MTTVLDLYEATSSYNPLSESTRYGWRHSIKGFEHLLVSEIDKPFVVKHRSMLLGKGYKQGYVRTRLGYLGSMWQTGNDIELIDGNPWRGSLKKLTASRKKYPQKIFNTFFRFHSDPLFMAVWYHGFRISEIANILPEDFVIEADIPYINIQHNHIRRCKNNFTQRQVPIHPEYFKFIDNFKFSTNPKAGDYFSRKLKKHTGISAHGIRHSFINRMRAEGIEYSIAMALVGHKPDGQTAQYGEVFMKDMHRAIAKIK